MIHFSQVEQSVRELKQQMVAGEIDQDTFESHLLELVDVAPDGYYWMFGHETESWYRHDGQQWVKKDPDKLRDLAAPEDDEPTQPEDMPDNPQPTDPSPLGTDNSLSSAWRSINWAWFVASLLIIGLVGWIVYTSSLT
jgi:hypothetical protein